MHITDPVADMLTRIRNASSAKHETVDVPASNLKKGSGFPTLRMQMFSTIFISTVQIQTSIPGCV